jgi:putative DNA primase/helicase
VSAVAEFQNAMRSAGLTPPDVIEPGKLHRFSTNGRNSDDAGWCRLFDDGMGGVFGDWRTGLDGTWQATRSTFTKAEHEEFRRKVAEDRARREAEERKRHAGAAEKAAAIWNAATPADDHEYLRRKVVKAQGLRQHEGRLVIPLRDSAGKLHSLQFIAPDGEKRYLPDGAVSGHYFAIGKPSGVVCVAEGYATAASIYEATGHAVAVAFDAGNLAPVAQAIKAKLPEAKLILCADNDFHADGKVNTGVVAATKAAQAVGGLLAVPEISGDFNDLALAQGAEAVRLAVEAATRADAPTLEDGVKLIRAADLKPEPIRWIWDGWLARGKLHILAGASGTGKTTIALALAATITNGGRWPDGTRSGEPGNVLIWSGEDDPSDTLLPRLMAMGADTRRVFFVGDAVDAGQGRTFDPARDLRDLMGRASEICDVRLMICDPVVNAVAGDSHKNTEVRRALQPLVEMAAKLDAGVLGISHFSKGSAGRDPVERVTGSIAFGALARIVLAAAKIEEDGEHRRILARAKSNIGTDTGGFNYELEQTQVEGHAGLFASRVLWGRPIEGSARELLAQAEGTGEDGGAISEAGAWLRDVLSRGPVAAKEIKRLAEAQGMAWRTVQFARDRIGAGSQREGFGKGSTVMWGMPIDARNAIDASPERLAPMEEPCAYGESERLPASDEEVF